MQDNGGDFMTPACSRAPLYLARPRRRRFSSLSEGACLAAAASGQSARATQCRSLLKWTMAAAGSSLAARKQAPSGSIAR